MKTLQLAAALALSAMATMAQAFPIAAPGTEGLEVIVANTGHVFATYEGNSASYSNDLLLDGVFVFNNHTTPVGATVDLGEFTAGTELKFSLFVNNTGYTYFTGPASRNPDLHEHARVQTDWQPGVTLTSFEDLYSGPYDYNDLSFSFTNTKGAVPEPGAMSLLAVGVGVLLARSRQKRQA
jgi:hypothetical protein